MIATANDIRWLFWQKSFGVVFPDIVITIDDELSEDFTQYFVRLDAYKNINGRKGRAIGSWNISIFYTEVIAKRMSKKEYFAELVNEYTKKLEAA